MEDALAGYAALYSQTLEAGRHLHDALKDSEFQDRLQTELQALEKAWDKTQAELEKRRELVKTGVQVRLQLNAGKASHHQLLLNNSVHHNKLPGTRRNHPS